MASPIRCLLWDFGDTLCDERFIWNSGPEWMAIYDTFDDGLGQAWCLGEVDTPAFAAELATRMTLSAEVIATHMRERCNHIVFHPFTYAFFRERHRPQAIVTVNPDLFSEVIVPRHRLDQAVDAIVTSWEETSDDKGRLCEVAIDRLGGGITPSEALLIDNRQDCLASWAARGGAGYLFTTDDAFRRDVADGIDALIAPGAPKPG